MIPFELTRIIVRPAPTLPITRKASVCHENLSCEYPGGLVVELALVTATVDGVPARLFREGSWT